MPKYQIVHNNDYSFQTLVNASSYEARLRPVDSEYQQVNFSQFVLRPLACEQSSRQDEFGNHVHHFDVSQNLQSFKLSAIHTVTTVPRPTIDLTQSQPWEQVAKNSDTMAEVEHYRAIAVNGVAYTSPNQALSEYAALSFLPNRPLLDASYDLMQRIYHDFQYDPSATTVTTKAIDAFELGRGVCQDFSHIAIACLHSLGLPARYVSGYLDTLSAPLSHFRATPANASHAWFSVFDPEFGWIDFDPTNDCMPNEKHITVAYGRDYDDIAPLTGQVDSNGRNQLTVRVELKVID